MALIVNAMAPDGEVILEYDRQHLALYAAMLDADETGEDWMVSASSLMGLNTFDHEAEACWVSHLERAKWIVGDGLAHAVSAFGKTR